MGQERICPDGPEPRTLVGYRIQELLCAGRFPLEHLCPPLLSATDCRVALDPIEHEPNRVVIRRNKSQHAARAT